MKNAAIAAITPVVFALLACSSGDPAGPEGAAAGAPTLNGSSGSAGLIGVGDGQNLLDDEENGDSVEPGTCHVPEQDGSCIGQAFEGESIPLDIYVMFDQSGSMCSCTDPEAAQTCPNPECTETRLDAVREATRQFLNDPESAGIGVGLGHFGQQPIGQASCDVADYETPLVGVGTLPEHAPALMAALNQLAPTGETPTGAAIRGACDYAESWKASAPGRQIVILLLTDGKPEAPATCAGGQGACCPNLPDAVEAAATCREQLGIKTYVLGVGPLLENLAQIAVAGGTEHAYLVEGGDVATEVLAALNRIRGDAAIPCKLQLPEPPTGQELMIDRINLEYQSSSCEPTRFYSVRSAAECGSEDGWYYDDPERPSSIELCPQSCDRVSAPGGSLFFSVGCETQFRIR